MQQIHRADFLPSSWRDSADIDRPFPIGFGQTNSQPTTVRRMLLWLDPQPGDKVLDVGSGSGWSTALLATLVGKKGTVYAVERFSGLVEMGRKNCAKYDLSQCSFYEAGPMLGLPEHAPYDRILVSATAQELPRELLAQLAAGGRMVIPVGDTILEVYKAGEDSCDITPHAGYEFVPLL